MLIERSLTPADLDLICRHRKEMFRASGRPDRSEQTLNTMTTSFLAWLEPRLLASAGAQTAAISSIGGHYGISSASVVVPEGDALDKVHRTYIAMALSQSDGRTAR
jgi:hypothetical protein